MHRHLVSLFAAVIFLGQASAPSPESVRRAQIAEQAARGPTTRRALPPPPVYRGIDLAKAPVTIQVETLPDIWEPRPPGSHSYEVRSDVTITQPEMGTTIYFRPDKKLYVIQHDGIGASTLHFYGPFTGDPKDLPPATPAPATRPMTRPG